MSDVSEGRLVSLSRRSGVTGGCSPATFVLVVALSAVTAHASDQVPYGPRAIAMGGAYTSVVDDATALFWNPGGMVFVPRNEFYFTRADLFSTPILDQAASLVFPYNKRQAFGVGWYGSGLHDDELEFAENQFNVAYAVIPVTSIRRLHLSGFSVGATGKYLTRNTGLDGTSVRRGGGFGLDLGARVELPMGLHAGVVSQDVTGTRVLYTNSPTSSFATVERNTRGSLSCDLGTRGVVAFDVDDRWHAGVEYAPFLMAAVRAGVQKDREGDEPATWALGLGVRTATPLGSLRVDYAFEHHPVLDGTHYVGAALSYNFNPSALRIKSMDVPKIAYASLSNAYERDSIGTVVVENTSRRPIRGRLVLEAPEVTQSKSTLDFVIDPRVSRTLPLRPDLRADLLTQGLNGEYSFHATAEYDAPGSVPHHDMSRDVYIYGRNKISWPAGMDQVGAFVTSEDSLIEVLGSMVTRLSRETREAFHNDNLARMAAAFDALTEMGITYKSDPDNSFDKVRAQAVDVVFYPRETLTKKTGDCDDTAALVAALMGNLNLRSQLVDAGDHVLLMVEGGPELRTEELGLPNSLLKFRDGEAWIPLETLAIDSGFVAAWQKGAKLVNNANFKYYDLSAAQRRYPPMNPNMIAATLPPLNPTSLRARLVQDAAAIEGWRAHATVVTGDEAGELVVARIQFRAGNLAAARGSLDKAVAKNPHSAPALNNLGVVNARMGDTGPSLERFRAASNLAKDNAGVWLNLGLLEYAAGDSTRGKQSLAKGIQIAGGNGAACRLLGWPASPSAQGSTNVPEFLKAARAVSPGGQLPHPGLPAYLLALYYWNKD